MTNEEKAEIEDQAMAVHSMAATVVDYGEALAESERKLKIATDALHQLQVWLMCPDTSRETMNDITAIVNGAVTRMRYGRSA